MAGGEVTRDRRRRQTFWIDDAIVDRFAPIIGRYSYGADAIAVYTVLARRADRDGESWPGVPSIAMQAATSERTARRALHLLEALGLVEIAACYEAGSNRQTSNLYTLLTPPEIAPEIDPDPANWPTPERRRLLVMGSNRAQVVADGRLHEVAEAETPCQFGSPSPVSLAVPPCQAGSPPPASLADEGVDQLKDITAKDRTCTGAMTADLWIVEEVGLSNTMVWSAVLEDIKRWGVVPAHTRETWLERAQLVGREGDTLLVGAPGEAGARQVGRWQPEIRRAVQMLLGGWQEVRVVAA